MLSAENWTYCFYKSGEQRAIISLGGEIHDDRYVELFFSTVIDPDGKELTQRAFEDLSQALKFINSAYAHWRFIDGQHELENQKSSGCSTCQAH